MDNVSFDNLSEDQWSRIVDELTVLLYPSGVPDIDYLKLGGWLSDLEAGDVSVDEVVASLAHSYTLANYDSEDVLQEINIGESIVRAIHLALDE